LKPWQWAALVIVPFCVGVAIGWHQKPDRVVTTERVVTREDTHAREQVKDLTKQLESAKRHTIKQTVRKPDGTVTISEDTHVENTRDVRTDIDTKTEVQTVKIVETAKTVEVTRSAPQWFAGPLVILTPGSYAPALVGVTVGRHLFGPVAIGVSAVVPLAKPASLPSIGVSLTVAF
jgi:hypothetical protein